MYVFNVFKDSGRCDSAECDGSVFCAVEYNKTDAQRFIDSETKKYTPGHCPDFSIEKQEIGTKRSFDDVT